MDDVARVAQSLVAILGPDSGWVSGHLELSGFGAGQKRFRKVLGLPVRVALDRKRIATSVCNVSPDVLHLHWARNLLFRSFDESRLVVHAHGSDVRFSSGWLSNKVQDRLRKAAIVLASTPDLMEFLPTNARYFPSPVDTDFFRKDEDSTLGDGTQRIFIFARFLDVKGAKTLIEFARAVRKARPRVELFGVGGGTHDVDAIRAGVVIRPSLGRVELLRMLRSSDLVIGQQRLGILSLSELEAMATERVVLSPVKTDLYDRDIPVLRPTGVDDMVDMACSLLENPSAGSEIGVKARDYVVEQHGWSAVEPRLVSIYDSVADGTVLQ